MKKLLGLLLGLIIKKRKRVITFEGASRQAREQIKILKDKGLSLPVMTL
ncbi:hypothetical protein HY345_02105 [Candidatus Microgenomates bacterium]|nr:hypothetical protein [Candidatus Microgenomates bacterium]